MKAIARERSGPVVARLTWARSAVLRQAPPPWPRLHACMHHSDQVRAAADAPRPSGHRGRDDQRATRASAILLLLAPIRRSMNSAADGRGRVLCDLLAQAGAAALSTRFLCPAGPRLCARVEVRAPPREAHHKASAEKGQGPDPEPNRAPAGRASQVVTAAGPAAVRSRRPPRPRRHRRAGTEASGRRRARRRWAARAPRARRRRPPLG